MPQNSLGKPRLFRGFLRCGTLRHHAASTRKCKISVKDEPSQARLARPGCPSETTCTKFATLSSRRTPKCVADCWRKARKEVEQVARTTCTWNAGPTTNANSWAFGYGSVARQWCRICSRPKEAKSGWSLSSIRCLFGRKISQEPCESINLGLKRVLKMSSNQAR